MSSRRTLNQTEGSKNPATKFLEWKSNDKSFSYYNKAKGENIPVKLPFKFQFLEHFHTVKGWNDASSSQIYANEVKFISQEPLTVKAFKKKGDIAEGLYSEIRGAIGDAGGHYSRSIYVIDDSGEIINIQLKGAAVSSYVDFMDEHENQIEGAWVTVNKAEDKKKGAVKFSVPVFEIGKAFTPKEMELANDKYQDIVSYFDKYSKKDVEVEEPETVEEEVDELAF